MERKERYAIGQQDFKTLRKEGCVYVDKTRYIWEMIDSKKQYLFMARPRRFGKSLFLSTLRYFFEGERELFNGLFIETKPYNWEKYPVLHIDLNMERYDTPDKLSAVLNSLLSKWERQYDVIPVEMNPPQRFAAVIEAAHEKTGRQVVILVDEYDKPLVSNLNHSESFENLRSQLAAFYSNFKSAAEHIRLVFLTGVSRFSKLSIFSDINNLSDISFADVYADICGISGRELLENFSEGIALLAAKRGMDEEKILELLKKNYDGYRFAPQGSDIYNPWSVLNCLDRQRIGNYWNQTGTPTILAEALRNVDADLESVLNTRCPFSRLEGLDLQSIDPLALLYQTGYLTIKAYDEETDVVTLGVPNDEVNEGLMKILLPYYVKVRRGMPEGIVFDIIAAIREGKPEMMMRSFMIYLAGIPYSLYMDNENNFRNALYILLSLIGIDVDAEVQTSEGRIDLLIRSPKYVYVIELKYDGTAEEAIEQIDRKRYCLRFANDGRRIFKIGATFSSATRTIEAPIIIEETF